MTDKSSRENSLRQLILETKNLLSFHEACKFDYPLTDELRSFLNPGPLSANHEGVIDSGEEKVASLSLNELQNEAASCTRCSLQRQRADDLPPIECLEEKRPELLIVMDWEIPTGGKPAGVMSQEAHELLAKMLSAIHLNWEDVVICPIVKCPPPPGQEPSKKEIERCLPFLIRQIEILKPKVICAMGSVSSQNLLSTDRQIFALRGKFRSLLNTPLMPTFHPALLLKHPDLKKASWHDLQLIRQKINSLS